MTPNRRRSLILSSAALLLLAGAILALQFIPDDNPDSTGLPDTSPQDTKTTATLLLEKEENVLSIDYSPRDNRPFTIQRDSQGSFTLAGDDPAFPGTEQVMRSLFTYSIGLSSLTPVTDNASDEQLAQCGLDKPVMTWKVNRTDGTSVELMLGAESPTGTGRYARISGERLVCLLNSSQSAYLSKTINDIYDISFLPFGASTDDIPTWNLITSCTLEKENGVFEVRQRTDEELSGSTLGTSTFHMLQPYPYECSDYRVESGLLVPITNIAPNTIIEEHPADLAPYGLDNPARLSLTAEDGWAAVLLIGDYSKELNGRFVMIEGYDAVLLDKNGDYVFLEIDFAYLRSSQLWIYDIKDVSSVEYQLDGISRTLIFEHNTEDNTLRGWLDDSEITEINARRLYVFTLKLMQDGGTDQNIPESPPQYRFTINLSDGKSDVLELYAYNDRQYLVVLNGVNSYLFITKANLQQTLLNKFAMVDQGQELPRM